MTAPACLATIDELSCEWLTAVVGAPVTSFDTERIGTGQVSENHRVRLTGSDGARLPSVVVKVAASDETSRASGVALGLYEREVRFYLDVAPLIDSPAIARCLHAQFSPDTQTFVIVLEDVAPAVVGDEIAGATADAARAAVSALAELHAPCIGRDSLEAASWLNRDSPIDQNLLTALHSAFVERYAERLDPRHREVAERLVASFDAYTAKTTETANAAGLVHGDYRLDNLLFGIEGSQRPVVAVDWQTVTWGPAATDLAYFLGTALTVDDRRELSDELVELYHAGLGSAAYGDIAELREDLRAQVFFGVVMSIVSPMLVERTERGDDMFMTVFARHCEHVLDLDATALLPEPAAPEPLRPEPVDEHPHERGPEDLWNESWYFDVADADAGVGAFIRLGLTPNIDNAWYTALVCGPGMPTVAVVDFDLDPGNGLHVSTGAITAAHEIVDPLTRAHATLSGRGEAFDDPADLLVEGATGRPVRVELDLHWETTGEPYLYRLTSRYEIPCRVTGTITLTGGGFDASSITIDAPGQRDHSWGVRDWWAMDWVWSTAHLDDGTHLHGLDLRLPDMPSISIGYTQGAGRPIAELTTHHATEELAESGLPVRTVLAIEPGAVELEFTPLGHGPLRLVSQDGRVALFPRAWGTVTARDGRRGVGWLEWNHNVAH